MYEIAKLCRKIQMPEDVARVLLTGENTGAYPGLPVLALHLQQACFAWEQYRVLGISEDIYIDTMGCFSRFVREHLVSFGTYGFDRDFWTTRQTGCRLFRIGQLEYELLTENGQNLVSIHIPSDAVLKLPLLRKSWEDAKALIDRTFPEFREANWVCGSWLLSPNLKELLPETSNILKFQKSFRLSAAYAEEDFREWVYKRTDIPDRDLPENTTLQRNLKRFLLAGGSFLSGEGTLIPDPFR